MKNLADYAEHILSGNLVAIPTETVYGLGGNAFSSSSIQKIYKLKGRPRDNPLICHVYSFEFAENNVFELSEKTRAVYKILVDKFWPGPLSIIGKKRPNIAHEVTNSGKVAVRCPNNNLTLELLRISNVPIAAPSANRSNHISPTSPKHVMKEFDENYMDCMGVKVMILDGGECCDIGIESTVIEYRENENNIVIFRYGAISKRQIELVLGSFKDEFEWIKNIRISYFSDIKETLETFKEPIVSSPGMNIKHYSPIVNTNIIKFISNTSKYEPVDIDLKSVIVIDLCSKLLFFKSKFRHYFSLCESKDFSLACKSLFSVLHQAEDFILNHAENPDKCYIFIVEFEISDDFSFPLWDRIYRASSGKILYVNSNELKGGKFKLFKS